MPNLSAAMALEFQKFSKHLRKGLKFTFPDGVKRYSDVALCSRNGGYHEPRILDWGTISDAVSDRRNALQVSDWSDIRLNDHDGEFAQRAERYELKGSPAVFTYSSREIADIADFFQAFTGVLLDWKKSDRVVSLQCGPAWLLALVAPFPDIQLTLQDWEDLPDEAVNVYAPISPYGYHASWGFGNTGVATTDGQIEPVYVGEYKETNLDGDQIGGSKYVFGVGQVQGFDRVFADGLILSDTDWNQQAIHEIRGGVEWSRLQFKEDMHEKKITADVRGIETVGDGSGTVIVEPAEMIQHFVVNFVLNRYRKGLWNSAAGLPIDTAYLTAAATYLGQKRIPPGYKGGRYIEAADSRGTGMKEIDEWCASMEMKGLTTIQGKIAFGADDLDPLASYINDPHFQRVLHELVSGPLTPTYPSLDAAKRVIGETSFSHAQGAYTEKLSVRNLRSVEDAADSVSCPWGPPHI